MNKGYTLIEVVFSLMITSICILLLSSLLSIIVKRDFTLYNGDDEKNIHQMRLIFVLGKDYQIIDDMLYFRYLNKDMNYSLSNQKLILEDGYQVFFNDIDNASFQKEDDCYYFSYQRNKQSKERVIGCE